MRFYTQSHRYYCGIDLHARWMYLCILDPQGEVLLHRNLRACPEAFLKAVEPYRQDLVVAVECIFSWYWLADLCAEQGIEFPENRRPTARRPDPGRLRLPAPDAFHPRSAAPSHLPDAQTR